MNDPTSLNTPSSSSGSIPQPPASSSDGPSRTEAVQGNPRINLPQPPPSDRQPPPKGRSTHHPVTSKMKMIRKGKDRRKEEQKSREQDGDWTIEGGLEQALPRGSVSSSRQSSEFGRMVQDNTERPQLLEVRSTSSREEKPKGRSLAKKTSQLFSRKDKDKDRGKDTTRNGDTESITTTISDGRSSVNLPVPNRQNSHSSSTSEMTTNTSSSRSQHHLYRPPSHNNRLTKKSAPAQHARRASQDSGTSWHGARSSRSGSISTYESPIEPTGGGRQASHRASASASMSASVPTLSRNALPTPAPNGGQNGSIPSRMSSWFSNFLPTSQPAVPGPSSGSTAPSGGSPARRNQSAAASFLNAARQRAVDGVRHLLDSEAQPDKCQDTIWVMGIGHPGWRPVTPTTTQSPTLGSPTDLPAVGDERRRGSGSSSGKASPPEKKEKGDLRPTGWPKKKDSSSSSTAISPPTKGFTNLFSTSTLSLALPSGSGSPSRNMESSQAVADSPSKARKGKVEKEVIRWPDQFYADFKSRVWCTYRSQYAPILSLPNSLLIPSPDAYYNAFGPPLDISSSSSSTPPPRRSVSDSPTAGLATKASSWGWSRSAEERGLTSDAGWGCMLRTGQSMLANALIHLHLGRDWRLDDQILSNPTPSLPKDPKSLETYADYVQIMSWFMDDPSPLCPFSVHRMALIGKELGKEVGEWFGPSTAAGALKTLANSFSPCGLAVATATDSMIYKSDVYAASNLPSKGWDIPSKNGQSRRPSSSSGGKTREWGDKAVLILIGLRLGLEGVNPIYYDSIKALFTFPQSVGIAGGRPSSSYYFVGTQANSLFYLDPHFTRPAIPLEIPPAPSSGVDKTTKSTTGNSEVSSSGSQTQPEEQDTDLVYKLDVIDVDELSDSGSSAASPSNSRGGRKPKSAKQLSISPSMAEATPPASPHIPHSNHSETDDLDLEVPTTPIASRSPDVFDSTTTPPIDQETPKQSHTTAAAASAASSSSSSSSSSIDPQKVWYANAYPPSSMRTFHCEKVRKMPLSGLDPSMLLGFLCISQVDFDDFCERVAKLPQRIFTVQDEPPTWDDDDDAGLESVSEPDLDDLSDTLPDPDIDQDQELEVDDTQTLSRKTVPIYSSTAASVQVPSRSTPVLEDEEWTKTESIATPTATEKPSPFIDMPRNAILQPKPNGDMQEQSSESLRGSLGSGRSEQSQRPPILGNIMQGDRGHRESESWIKPLSRGQEAPNGSSIL